MMGDHRIKRAGLSATSEMTHEAAFIRTQDLCLWYIL